MSVFVVDASVGLKWFVPEDHSDKAEQLQDPSHECHAPTLFDVELGNILWKKIRRAELTRADADAILAQFPGLPVARHPEAPLLPVAFDLADRTQRTVSADLRWWNALQGSAFAANILRVEDLP